MRALQLLAIGRIDQRAIAGDGAGFILAGDESRRCPLAGDLQGRVHLLVGKAHGEVVFFVASRNDGIEAFMVKFTVSAARTEIGVNNMNAAAAKSDLVVDNINPFLK